MSELFMACSIVLNPCLGRPENSNNCGGDHSNEPDHSGDGKVPSFLEDVLEAMKGAHLAVLLHGLGQGLLRNIYFFTIDIFYI